MSISCPRNPLQVLPSWSDLNVVTVVLVETLFLAGTFNLLTASLWPYLWGKDACEHLILKADSEMWQEKKKPPLQGKSLHLLWKPENSWQEANNSRNVLAQVFSCKFCEIFKNAFIYRTTLMAASELKIMIEIQIINHDSIRSLKIIVKQSTIKFTIKRYSFNTKCSKSVPDSQFKFHYTPYSIFRLHMKWRCNLYKNK